MGEASNKVMGKTRKAVGRATGNKDMEGRGRVQETAGKAQGGVRKAGRAVSRGIDKAAGKVGEVQARRKAKRPAAPKTKSRTRTTETPRARRTTTKTTTVEEEPY